MNSTKSIPRQSQPNRSPAPPPALLARPRGSNLTYAELRQIVLEQLG